MRLLSGLLVFCLITVAASSLFAQCPAGNVYTVTNANDGGNGSLRQLIDCANANSGVTTINFSIPGTGPHTILLQSDLPVITRAGLYINGLSQNGEPGSIILEGNNERLEGISVRANDCHISGIHANNFRSSGFISFDVSRTIFEENISTNNVYGIFVGRGPACDSVFIIANYLGVTPAGTIGGNTFGVEIFGCSDVLMEDNIMAGNLNGMRQNGGENDRNTVIRGSFYCNQAGISNVQNPNPLPTITSATTTEISGTGVAGSTISLYRDNAIGCGTSPCQGNEYLGETIVPAGGNWIYVPSAGVVVLEGEEITATSTRSTGGTSAFTGCVGVTAGVACAHSDYDALMALYNSTNGAGWLFSGTNIDPASSTEGWGRDCSPCDWYGVNCNESDRVTCLDMDGGSVGCSGPFGAGNNLVGPIPEAISGLTELERIRFYNNSITGPLPEGLGALSNLIWMDIHGNDLDGPLPASFSNLDNLTYLRLQGNQLSGTLDVLSGMSNLESMIIDNNMFVGEYPSSLANLPTLAFVQIFDNQLDGELPLTFSQAALTTFIANNNNFTGAIPESLADIPSLNTLRLFNNDLSGCIPSGLLRICGGVNISNNLQLPWEGDISQFCLTDGSNSAQTGAPCNDSNPATENDIIDADCNCTGELPIICPTGTTVVVTNTNDSGEGSLRQAIECVNEDPDLDIIEFNIPGSGPHNIELLSTLPWLYDGGTVIDATTQPGWDYGAVKITTINSSWSALNDFGFDPDGMEGPLTIRGLQFIGFSQGIYIVSAVNAIVESCVFTDNRVGLIVEDTDGFIARGNRFGTNATGTVLQSSYPGNSFEMVLNFGSTNAVVENNIFASNDGAYALEVYNGGHQIIGNTFGLAADGVSSLGLGYGIYCVGSSESVLIQNNEFANSSNAGISVHVNASSITIQNNSFSCSNSGSAILHPGANTYLGPSLLEVSPELISGTSTIPNGTVEIYREENGGCNSMFCKGFDLLGSVTTDAQGNWTLNGPFASPLAIGETVTATITDTEGHTSRFSSCGEVILPCGPNDPTPPTINCPDTYTMTCTEAITLGYDQDLTVLQPADILMLTGTPITDDDCPVEDLDLTFLFISDNRDECGEGTAELEFTVTDAGGNSASCIQQIQFQAVGPIVTLGSQNDVYCEADNTCTSSISYNFSVGSTCDPEPPLVIVQLDLDATDSDGDGTYTLADFTAVSAPTNGISITVTSDGNGGYTVDVTNLPLGNHALRIIGADNCGNQTPALYQFTVDAAPFVTLVSQDDIFCDNTNDCTTDVTFEFNVGPACNPTPGARTVQLDLDAADNNGDGMYDLMDFTPIDPAANGIAVLITDNTGGLFTVTFFDVPLGEHAARIATEDECGNEIPVLYRFVADDCFVDPPVCETSRTVNLEDDGGGTGSFDLLASELILSLPTDCSNANKVSIYPPDVYNQPGFQPGVIPIGYVFDCSHLGSNLMRVYVTDDFGNSDFCTVDVVVTDTDAVCLINQPTCTDGIQNGNETDVDCGGPDCPECTIPCNETSFLPGVGVSDPTICLGDEVTVNFRLTATGNPPYTADVSGNGLPVSTITLPGDGSAVSFTITPTASSSYRISNVRDAEGCGTGISPAFVVTVRQPAPEPQLSCAGSTSGSVTISYVEDPDVAEYFASVNGGPDQPISGGTFTATGLPEDTDVEVTIFAVPMNHCASSETSITCRTDQATCTDGVQNGNETGVDCGGPDCAACIIPCVDTDFTYTIGVFNLFSGPGNSCAGDEIEVSVSLTATANPPYVVTVREPDGTLVDVPYDEGVAAVKYFPLATTSGFYEIISVTDAEGCSTGLIEEFFFPVDQPLSVPDLRCQATTQTSVRVGWTEDPGVDSYEISYDGGPAEVVGGGSYTVSGLEPGQEVSFVLTAYPPGNCDPVTAEVDCTMNVDPCTGQEPSVSQPTTILCTFDGTLDLSFLEIEITGGEASVFVNWYSDAEGLNSIADPTFFAPASAPEIVYVEVVGVSCASPVTAVTINYENALFPAFTNLVTELCAGGSAYILPAPDNGVSGNWNLTGIGNVTSINPNDFAGQTLELVFAPDPELCADFFAYEITVTEQTAPDFTNLAQEVCATDGTYTLPAQDDNGVAGIWSLRENGDLPVTNELDVSERAGETMTYFFQADSGCNLPYELNVSVGTPVAAVFDIPVDTICIDSLLVPVFTGADAGAMEFLWSSVPAPLVPAGNTATPTLSWSDTGNVELTLIVANGGCTSDPITRTIYVKDCADFNRSSACDPVRDSTALVELYNVTGGTSWSVQDNWLTPAPIADWEGVFVNTEGCVTILDLDGVPEGSDSEAPGGVNMIGELPNALGQLKELDSLYLTDNFAVGGGLPDSLYTLPHLYLLFVENMDMTEPVSPLLGEMDSLIVFVAEYNQWTFADLLPAEPAFEAIRQADGAVALQPQDSIFEPVTITLSAGENLNHNLGFELNANDNVYTWYRNGVEEQETTGGDGVLAINNVQPTDAGTYFARITNPGVSGVELYARGVEVVVTAATCDDGIMNGDETGVDCGGPDCPACEACANVAAVIPFPDINVCPGTNLGYEIRGTGGQPPYQIRFVNEIGDTLTINSSLQGGFQAVAGEYTIEVVSVTDADGCSALPENLPLATATVVEEPELVLLEAINPGCGVSDGGVIRLVARGGTPPYTFSISAGDANATDSILTVTNLPAGSYLVEISDVNNCTTVDTTIVLSDVPVFLSCPQDLRDTVPADVDTLSLELPLPETNGCPPGALSYTITGSTTASGNGPVGIQNFNVGESIITYSLGGESCSFSVIIDQLEGPNCSQLSLRNVELVSPTCGQDNGSISFDLVGLTEAFDFTWSSGDEELNPAGLAAGLYLLRVQERMTECNFSVGFLMRQSSPVSVSCGSVAASDNTIADGSLLFSAEAATYPVTVAYEGPLSGFLTLDNTAPDTVEIGGLLPGDYTITVTDANGCTATCATTILSAACTDVITGLTSDITICNGESFDWQGMSYTAEGTYFDTLQTAAGCDSILRLNLALDDSPPVFTVCPPDMEVILNLGSQSSLDLTWPVPVVSANCDVFDFSGENSATGITRDTVITYEATTARGRSAICSFRIEVIRTDTMTFFVDVGNIRRVGQDTMMVPIGVMNFDRGAAFQLHFFLEDGSGTGAFLEGVNPLHPLLESGLDPEIIDDHTLNLVWFTSNPQPNTFPDSTLLFEIPVAVSGDPGDCTRLGFVEDLPEVTMAFRLGEEVFPTTIGGQVCRPALADIGGTIVRLDPSFAQRPVPNVEVSLFEPGEQSSLVVTPTDGGYFFLDRLREQPYEIEPFLDRDYLNGVSILDVVLIRNMVIGTINNSSPSSPYQYIAANLQADDCRISVRDLFIEMRMLAGVFETFPGVNSYRFIDARHELPSVEEIRAGDDEWCVFPETITIDPLGEDSLNNDFIAVKMGDVSLNARSPQIAGRRFVSVADLRFDVGDTVRVNPRYADDMIAAELHWSFDQTVLRPLIPLAGDKESMNPADLMNWSGGKVVQVWSDLTGGAELTFIASAAGRLSHKLALSEMSLGANEGGDLFRTELRTGTTATTAAMLVSASPNPFRGELTVSVNSPVSTSARMVVFDLAGRTLESRQVKLVPGAQHLTVPTEEWPAGVYNLHLTSPYGDHWLRLLKH